MVRDDLSLVTTATAFLLIGSLIAALNLCNALYSWRTGRFHSRVPLLGAIFGIVGCILYPPLRPYAWLPLLLDVGTLELLWNLPAIVRRERQYAPALLQTEYRLVEAGRCVTLSLFRSGRCILHFELGRIADGREAFDGRLVGAWTQPAETLLHLDLDAVLPTIFEFEINPGGALHCVHGMTPWPVDDPRLHIVGMQLKPLPTQHPSHPQDDVTATIPEGMSADGGWQKAKNQ